ncbi:MAG: endo-1,4-beta-xylanase [Bacteroidota bacterium]
MKKIIYIFTIIVCIGHNSYGQVPSLKEKYKDYFPIGAAVGKKHLSSKDTTLLKHHFASITAENDMKPQRTIKSKGNYTFEAGDYLLDFAQSNNMLMRGHTLVWYNQTDDWFYRDAKGDVLPKKKLFKRMQNYIKDVLTHYEGKMYAWDVVNEAVSDYKDKFYRDDIDWFKICGPEYIEKAFVFAHKADPSVKLYYNDYDLINPQKRDKVYKMVKALLAKGIPIHGIGMQGHWTLEDVNRQNLSEAIDLFASLGVDVQITELDISVYPYYHNMDRSTLPKKIRPYTEDLALALAAKYKEVFEVLREKKDKITGVTFWGVADDKTWLSKYVVDGRTDYPLLFDANFQPKKAFFEILDF